MMRRVGISLTVLSLAACASGGTTAPAAAASPVRDRVTVDVHANPATASQRVVAAFMADSLIVARSEGGVVTAEPITLKSIGVDVAIITYSATVVPTSDSTSQVTVLAYQQDLARSGDFGQTATADARKKLVRSDFKMMYRPIWARVEHIAGRLSS